MSKFISKIIAFVTVFCMIFSASAYAGGGYGKSGKKKVGFFAKVGKAIKKAQQKAVKAIKESAQKAKQAVHNAAEKTKQTIHNAAEKTKQAIHNAADKTKQAIHNAAVKTKEAVQNAAKKTGMAIKTGGAKVSNALHDSSTWVKQKITGKKNRTWVCGHYDKNGKWVSGHWRKVESQDAGKPDNSPSQSGSSSQGGDFGGNDANQGGNFGGGNETPVGTDNGGSDISDPVMPEVPAEENPVESGDVSASEEQAVNNDEDPVLPEFSEDGTVQFDDSTSANEQSSQEPAQEEQPAASQESEQSSQESAQSEQTSQESEQTSQVAQQSGDSEMAAQFKKDTQISVRTMGMLMDDLLVQSKSITEFKRNAKPNMSFSIEAQNSVNSTYEQREKDAKLLARVIAWDLQNNNGSAGVYFTFFKNKMSTTTPEQRKLIADVIEQVRSSVKHNEGHADADAKAGYQQRLSEISKY